MYPVVYNWFQNNIRKKLCQTVAYNLKNVKNIGIMPAAKREHCTEWSGKK